MYQESERIIVSTNIYLTYKSGLMYIFACSMFVVCVCLYTYQGKMEYLVLVNANEIQIY